MNNRKKLTANEKAIVRTVVNYVGNGNETCKELAGLCEISNSRLIAIVKKVDGKTFRTATCKFRLDYETPTVPSRRLDYNGGVPMSDGRKPASVWVKVVRYR